MILNALVILEEDAAATQMWEVLSSKVLINDF